MPYMTRSWLQVKDRALDVVDAGFARTLREAARPSQIAYARIMAQHNGDPSGVEFRHHADAGRWAFVLSDVSVGGMRIQRFDTFGFSGHQCHETLIEAVQEMIMQGYRIEDFGALDRIAMTPQWVEGMSWMDKVRRSSTTPASI